LTGSPEVNVAVEWPLGLHVYNLRKGEYLGMTSKAEVEVEPGSPAIFSLLPYHVTGVSIRLPELIIRGQAAQVTGQLVLSDDARPSGHLFRLDAVPPSKRDGPSCSGHLCRRIYAPVEAGSATFSIPVAFNDPSGSWQIRVTDCVTGLSGTAEMRVKE
jgi:hypothetical protein